MQRKMMPKVLALIAVVLFGLGFIFNQTSYADSQTRYGCGCRMVQHPSCNLGDTACPGFTLCGMVGQNCSTSYISYSNNMDCIASDENPSRECKNPSKKTCYTTNYCTCTLSIVPPFMYCDGKGQTAVPPTEDDPNPFKVSMDMCE